MTSPPVVVNPQVPATCSKLVPSMRRARYSRAAAEQVAEPVVQVEAGKLLVPLEQAVCPFEEGEIHRHILGEVEEQCIAGVELE